MTENEIYREALETGNKLLMAHFRDNTITEGELRSELGVAATSFERRLVEEGYMKKPHSEQRVTELVDEVISYWQDFFGGSITDQEWADRCTEVVKAHSEERARA